MIDSAIKLVVIVGPTASGKTDLSLALGKKFNGEIICADSRTIYRGMDIGTAKPTAQEQAQVPHHLLDVINPDESLSAARFKQLAEAAIADIHARGKVPFLVGGSGLYVDSVVFDYTFASEADPVYRAELENMTDEQLVRRLETEEPEAAGRVDLNNRRRVIRALETVGQTTSKLPVVRPNTLMIGLTLNKEVAQIRIVQRIEKMLGKGFLNEAQQIGEKYGWDSPAFNVIGYRAFREVLIGTKTAAEGTADFARGDIALYKKQMTWFKRNRAIMWLDDPAQAEDPVRTFLA